MPNIVALASFGVFIVGSILLLRARGATFAIPVITVASFILMPNKVGISIPAFIDLDKVRMMGVFLFAFYLIDRNRPKYSYRRDLVFKILIAMMIVSPLLSVISNTRPIPLEAIILAPVTYYHAISVAVKSVILILPFFVGYIYLRDDAAHIQILKTLVIAALCYSVLILVELRLSPQIHRWVYGFFQHSLSQHVRGGGFRPVVFMPHALWNAFFIMMAMASAGFLWRHDRSKNRKYYLYAMIYLAVILFLCKSLGSMIFGLFMVLMVVFVNPRTQVTVAVMLVSFACLYPALRAIQIVPLDTLEQIATAIDADRARSLLTRFRNEELLLARAQDKPFFGWGGFGRNMLYSENGKSIVLLDGRWIIMLGIYGWFGFIALFGLLAWPVISLWRAVRRPEAGLVSPVTAGLCLLVGVNMIEILPNSTLPPWTWLIAGGLLGYAERMRGLAEAPETPGLAVSAKPRRRTVI